MKPRTIPYSKQFPPKKNDNGQCLCRWCCKVLEGCRRSFCSGRCRDEALLRCWPSYARKLVLKRDKGICASCGIDCLVAKDIIFKAMREVHGPLEMVCNNTMRPMPGYKAIELFLGIKMGNRTTFWEANHIIPVIEGGGTCGLENFETLCLICHKAHTRDLAARRAAARKAAKQGNSEQEFLDLTRNT